MLRRCEEAGELLLRFATTSGGGGGGAGGVDFVDLDPFGSPARWLPAAAAAVRPGGMLACRRAALPD